MILRQRARLLSGMVMWFYIAGHLYNHALGLVSLEAAEKGMRYGVLVWHSLPGTVLLYGAFATHLVLAMFSLYDRHTLRLPASELARIAFGLSFPLLLIGHAVVARVGWEWFGLLPQYDRVVWSLVASGSEGRQVALLAPGWAHGCMGLNLAFRHRPLYQRWKIVFLLLAVLLPLAAAAGFLNLDREITGLLQDPAWRAHAAPLPNTAQLQSLGALRDNLLHGYLCLLALVLLARGVRWLYARGK